MPIKQSNLKYFLPSVLILGAIIRLLFLVTPPMDSDQAITGLMARHILGGEFPFFFYGQDYCGSIEAYLVSIIFFFFGAARFTLDLTICIESIFFILFIYYLARILFDKGTALLSALFSALASYYLIFHSVLARAAYIEIPIIGVLLFILSLKIYRGQGQSWNLFALGLFCGLGVWTHFLIVFYLPPIFLLFLIKDRWFWGRPTILFFFLGLLVGGLPLWVHNIDHPLVTWHYLMHTTGDTASFLSSLKDFFFYRFPEVLGVKDNETQKFFILFFSISIYLVYLGLFFFLILIQLKKLLAPAGLRSKSSSGFELLLLFLLFYPLIFALSGFASAHTSRYLQPLFSSLPILFAALAKKIKTFSWGLAFFFILIHLFSNTYGTIRLLPLLSPNRTLHYRQDRENDQKLLSFLNEKKIHSVYTSAYWISVRLTFEAREEIIFASPVGDRYPLYTERIDRDPHPGYLFPGDDKGFEDTLKVMGGTYQKTQVFGYSLYYNFSPPSFQFNELEPAQWKVMSKENASSVKNIFDRDLLTHWSSGAPQKPGVSLQIDLGRVIPDLGRITLLAGKPEEIPRGLRLEISRDGRNWKTLYEVAGLWEDLFWSGPHPFFRPGFGRTDLVFPPQTGRFIRLTQIGNDPTYQWSVAECFVYRAQPKLEHTSPGVEELVSFLRRFNLTNIYSTPWIQSQLPSDWQARQRALALQEGEEGLIQTLANPVFVVGKDNPTALIHFLKNNFRRPFQETGINGQTVFSIPSSSDHCRLLPSKKWRFQTNCNPQKAFLAADGNLSTRWTTDRPQVPGDFFQIDLGKLEKVARIRLRVGNSRNDFPRGLAISYSVDNRTWFPLNPIMSPVLLRWTGETLLKGSADLDFVFPPTPMGHIRITQTGKDEVYYWSIHEIELYGRSNR
jgi:4-amino-4-deoxy-L-arabinose transferase-like glycosyltransferase